MNLCFMFALLLVFLGFFLPVGCLGLLFPHLVLMFVVLCRGGPLEKEAAEAGAEGSLKKHNKRRRARTRKGKSLCLSQDFLCFSSPF